MKKTSTGATTTRTSSSSTAVASPTNHSSDDNEKELKIRQQQSVKYQQLFFLFVLLSVAFFILMRADQRKHAQEQLDNSIRSNHMQKKRVSIPLKEVQPHRDEKQPQQLKTNSQQEQGDDGSWASTLQELSAQVFDLDTQVRAQKALPNMIMETDPTGMKLTKELQTATKALLLARYGPSHPKRIVVDVLLPETVPDYTPETARGQFTIEMAPHDLVPVSVYYFLELARTWESGKIHRNAPHVLQVQSHSRAVHQSMPFQEYSPEFPHKKYTTGYAGRPSGPGWYISIQDNVKNHGPGSQQKHNPYEADALFGKLIKGHDVLKRIHAIPQKEWLSEPNQVQIPKITILTPVYNENSRYPHYEPWQDPTATTTS